MATKDIKTQDPMIDPQTGEFRVLAPGQTFKSVTAKIADIVLTPHTPLGWFGVFTVGGSVAVCLLVAVIYVLTNFVIDILHSVIDPRVLLE